MTNGSVCWRKRIIASFLPKENFSVQLKFNYLLGLSWNWFKIVEWVKNLKILTHRFTFPYEMKYNKITHWGYIDKRVWVVTWLQLQKILILGNSLLYLKNWMEEKNRLKHHSLLALRRISDFVKTVDLFLCIGCKVVV